MLKRNQLCSMKNNDNTLSLKLLLYQTFKTSVSYTCVERDSHKKVKVFSIQHIQQIRKQLSIAFEPCFVAKLLTLNGNATTMLR